MDEDKCRSRMTGKMVSVRMDEGREPAKVRIADVVRRLENRLKRLKGVLEIAEKLEDGSPLEQILWEYSLHLEHPR